MTLPTSIQEGQREARAVKTNGEGKRSTAHLNLTCTLADAIRGRRDFLNITPSNKRRSK